MRQGESRGRWPLHRLRPFDGRCLARPGGRINIKGDKMYLNEVTSTTRDREREGIGWKIFDIYDGELYSESFGGKRGEGIWLRSRDNKSATYPLGFHVCRTRKEARLWKDPGQRVIKVRFRDVLAEGTQGRSQTSTPFKWVDLRILVAKNMLILEN